MTSLLATMGAPRRSAESIRAKPRWLIPGAIIAAGWMLTTAVMQPWSVQATLDHLPASADREDRLVVAATLQEELPARLLILPLRLGAGWAAFSMLLLFLCRAFLSPCPVSFQQMFAWTVQGASIELLGRVAAMLRALLDLLPSPADAFRVPCSLRDVVPAVSGGASNALLGSLNLFTLWYVLVVTTGVSVLCQRRPRTAFLIVALAWVVSVIAETAIPVLLQTALSLSL